MTWISSWLLLLEVRHSQEQLHNSLHNFHRFAHLQRVVQLRCDKADQHLWGREKTWKKWPSWNCHPPRPRYWQFEEAWLRKDYSFYRGSDDGIKLIGWNGGENVENMSSHWILEDILVLYKNLSRAKIATVQGKKLIKVIGYTNNNIDFSNPVLALRTLAFPYGMCLSISPPKERLRSPIRLMIELEEDAILHRNVSTVRIFFMDKTNSLCL